MPETPEISKEEAQVILGDINVLKVTLEGLEEKMKSPIMKEAAAEVMTVVEPMIREMKAHVLVAADMT